MTQPIARATNGRHAARAAALHRQGNTWRLVILESSGAGAMLIDARAIAVGDAAAVQSTLEHHGVDRLIRVLPASSVVCRVVETPEGDPLEIAAALALIGEASLPANLPAHRRAAAPLAGINGHISPRAALVLGWSGASTEPPIGGIAESWTAEAAALLWLVRLRCRAAVFADRSTGSISAYAAGPKRLIVRAFRETCDSADQWTSAIDSCFEQTVAGAGLTATANRFRAGDIEARAERGETALFESIMPPEPSDQWSAEYGVAAAAALGALVAPVSMRPLFSLTENAVRADEPRAVRWLHRLASPGHAPWIIAAALAIALLGPLALAAARHAVLNAKSGGLAIQQEIDRTDALLDSFHDELGKRRWPMTSLLADLSGSLPVGVTVESIRLETGQRVVVRGSADTLELVNQLQSRLNNTGVFSEAAIDRTQGAEAGGVEFDLSARVVRPYSDAKGTEDFSNQTLAQRLYGADANSTNPDREGAGPPEPSTSASSAAESGPGDSAPSAPRERSSRPAAKPTEVPDAITDEEIAKLDASAAMKQWTSRQKASKQTGLDAATRDRLKAEAEKCRARMQAARKEASP